MKLVSKINRLLKTNKLIEINNNLLFHDLQLTLILSSKELYEFTIDI